MKKHIILFVLVLFSALVSQAKVKVYNTYEDFKNNKGTEYEYNLYTWVTVAGGTLHLTKDGKKEKIKCRSIWGFKYDDALFRICKKAEFEPMRVIGHGKFSFYENGPAHLSMLKNNSTSASGDGKRFYVSEDLNSKMTDFDFKMNVKKFVKKYPEHKEIYTCIDKEKKFTHELLRSCVLNYLK